jgi:hypothetical protein
MKARLVQTLGDRLVVYFTTPKHDHIVAQLDGYATVKPSDSLRMFVDMERSLFFSAEGTGQRLSGPKLD